MLSFVSTFVLFLQHFVLLASSSYYYIHKYLDGALDDLVVEEANYRLPHQDVMKYAFVLYPLSEIAPQLEHPVLKQRFCELAEVSALSRDNMTAVELDCLS